MVYNPRLSCKSLALGACSFSLSLIHQSEGSELLCHEDTRAALRRGPRAEELKPPANSQQGIEAFFSQPCEWAILGGTRSPSHLLRFSLTGAAFWCSGRQVAKIMEVPKGQKKQVAFSLGSFSLFKRRPWSVSQRRWQIPGCWAFCGGERSVGCDRVQLLCSDRCSVTASFQPVPSLRLLGFQDPSRSRL